MLFFRVRLVASMFPVFMLNSAKLTGSIRSKQLNILVTEKTGDVWININGYHCSECMCRIPKYCSNRLFEYLVLVYM